MGRRVRGARAWWACNGPASWGKTSECPVAVQGWGGAHCRPTTSLRRPLRPYAETNTDIACPLQTDTFTAYTVYRANITTCITHRDLRSLQWTGDTDSC